ncbi:MAG: putative heavy metal-binding protein [Anaerococcus sp.]
MIVTTTGNVDGRKVVEYKGIVFGEVVSGINFLKDMGAGFRNFLGGRSQGYEQELMSTRDEAIKEMEDRARAIGADAVIGMKMDYEVLGANNGMLMVTCSGTAVKLD